ncbi:MAG: nicotinamide-nucleotide amidohydrolase family protein [Nitrosomonas sp.]|nr:nicotinamide-nucleotide amidohydrolase family protein [Nitrosomonas sp.]
MTDQKLFLLAKKLGDILMQRGIMLASAESCTGGWIGQTITAIAGSSRWYERGFITYSNLSKQEMLGVDERLLNKFGAVSEQIALEMAAGAISYSHAQLSIAVTGIAGPGGATEGKPVGMICHGWAIKDGSVKSAVCLLEGDRESIRRQAVAIALQGAIDLLHEEINT